MVAVSRGGLNARRLAYVSTCASHEVGGSEGEDAWQAQPNVQRNVEVDFSSLLMRDTIATDARCLRVVGSAQRDVETRERACISRIYTHQVELMEVVVDEGDRRVRAAHDRRGDSLARPPREEATNPQAVEEVAAHLPRNARVLVDTARPWQRTTKHLQVESTNAT